MDSDGHGYLWYCAMNLRNASAPSTDICNKLHEAKGLDPLPFYIFLSALTERCKKHTWLFLVHAWAAIISTERWLMLSLCVTMGRKHLLLLFYWQRTSISTRKYLLGSSLSSSPLIWCRVVVPDWFLCITSSLCWSLIHNPSTILLMPRRAQNIHSAYKTHRIHDQLCQFLKKIFLALSSLLVCTNFGRPLCTCCSPSINLKVWVKTV